MWRFPDKQLVIKRASEMEVGQFFLYYDEADTAQLAVVATHAMEPDSRYCLRFTGDKAFQVISTDPFERQPDYYFQLPLKLQDTELVLKTQAVRITNNSAIGRLSARNPEGTFILAAYEARPGTVITPALRLGFDGVYQQPTYSPMYFDQWGLAYRDDGGKYVDFFYKE